MPDNFSRATQRFYCAGIDLVNTLDNIRERYFPVIENMRSYGLGWLQTRPGLTAIGDVVTGSTPVHSVRRLNDPAADDWSYIIGTGTRLARGKTAPFTQIAYNATNLLYSGYPVAMLPYRPDQSVGSWMYTADIQGHSVATDIYKMFKINIAGDVHQVGLPAPQDPPTVYLGDLIYGVITDKTETTVGWNLDGTLFTGPLTLLPARMDSATTLSDQVIYDVGNTGWASVTLNPADTISDIGPGTILQYWVGLAETPIMVHSMHPGTAATADVDRIIYDSGVAGMATVVPTKALDEFKQNAVVLINGQYARIVSVVEGPDEAISFRASFAAGIAAGQAIQVISSFRTFFPAVGGISGEAVGKDALVWTNASGAAVGTVGWIDITTPIDLTEIQSALIGPNTAMTDDDYIHISLKVNDLSLISQGRIIFNCDKEATPTYEKNFFYRAFTPNDLVPVAQGLQSALDGSATAIRNAQLRGGTPRPRLSIFDPDKTPSGDYTPESDPYAPPSSAPLPGEVERPTPRSQTGTGKSQWHEIRFKRKDLVRVGTDISRGYADINGFRLEITFSRVPTLPTEVTTFSLDSISAWGAGSLDSGSLEIPYYYRTRFRSSTTGVRSDYSPASFGGNVVLRETLEVTPAQTVQGGEALPPEVDKVDIERYGGTVTDWLYVGTVDLGDVFVDQINDDAARVNAPLSEGDMNAQPWLIIGEPLTGTISTLAGTMLDLSAPIPRDLMKGTGIKVSRSDGTFVYTAFRRALSTTRIEVDDHIGAGVNLGYEIAEPIYVGKPLPSLWGVWRDRTWACGDATNPGTLYYSERQNPDATRQGNKLEITAPSEPLIAGCIFSDRNYVFSSENMYEIVELGTDEYGYRQVPNGRGLWSRNALCVADRIWFLSKDGIYQTGGGEAISITDQTIRPLFPMEGVDGVVTNGFNPVYMSGEASFDPFRLSYYDGLLYFTYTDGTRKRTLVYNTKADPPGWFPDVYTPDVVVHYGDEGEGVSRVVVGGANAGTGKLYELAGNDDAGTAISWRLQTASFDGGDRRASKLWGDMVLDIDPAGAAVNIALGVNNAASGVTISPTSSASASRVFQTVEINSGEGVRGRNLALALSGTGRPKLYFWEPAWLSRPEGIYRRLTDYDLHGRPICKYVRGFYLECDTFGVAKSLTLRGDEGTVLHTFTANHNGKSMKYYPLATPVYTYETSLLGTDDDEWNFYQYELDYDPAPPQSDAPQTWDDFQQARWVQGCVIDGDTGGANVNVAIEVDEGVVQTTIQAGANQGPVNLNGRGIKAYSFDTPFITHLIRANPVGTMRLWSVKWIFEPEPELATNWKTQQTSHGIRGYQHLRDGYITLMSTSTVTLKIIRTDDSTEYTYTIPSTGGVRKKVYIPFAPIKGLAFIYELTSTVGFRVYKNDCEIRIKPWASEEQFKPHNPFGEQHGNGAARI